jgi:WD40 repeat protein
MRTLRLLLLVVPVLLLLATGCKPKEFILTVETSGQGTVALDPAGGTYQEGTVVAVTATPAALWHFDHWTGDLAGNDNPAQVAMDAAKSVTAVFAGNPTVTLTVTALGQGTVALDPPGGSYTGGTTVGLTAVAAAGWKFDHWGGALSGIANPATLTMDEDRGVTAVFVQSFTLTVTQQGQGTVALDPPGGLYAAGTAVSLTATPAAGGWYFTQWSGAVTGAANPATVTVNDNSSVNAAFDNTYTLSTETLGDGTVTLTPAGGTYAYGTSVTVTAVPDAGQKLGFWDGDLSGSTTPAMVVVNGNKAVRAVFADAASGLITGFGNGGIWKMTYTPDGSGIMTAGYDGNARLWDGTTTGLSRLYECEQKFLDTVQFGGPSRFISAGESYTLQVWDTLDESPMRIWDPVFRAAISGDGNRVLTSYTKDAVLRDTYTFAAVQTFTGHTDAIVSLAISPSGDRVATGSRDLTAKIWDSANGACLFTLGPDTIIQGQVTFFSDGTKLATCGAHGFGGNSVKIWNVSTGLLIRDIVTPNTVGDFAVSPDDTKVVTANVDGIVRLWDVASGNLLQTINAHYWNAVAVAYAPDGTRIASAGIDGLIKEWNPDTGALLATFKGHSPAKGTLKSSPDGLRVITSYDYGSCSAEVWDTRTGLRLFLLEGHTRGVFSAGFMPDGTMFTVSGDKTVNFWSALDGHLLRTIALSIKPFLADLSPDGTRMALSNGNDVRMLDIASGTLGITFTGHTDTVSDVAFSSDGELLVTGSGDGLAKLWDADTGVCHKTFTGHVGPVRCVAISPDGQTLLSGGQDFTAKQWDTVTTNCIRTFTHTNALLDVGFSPDGARMLTINNNPDVNVWDTATGASLQVYMHPKEPNCGAFMPDGKMIATGGATGKLYFWLVNP